jgi:uncharacterized membrane protein
MIENFATIATMSVCIAILIIGFLVFTLIGSVIVYWIGCVMSAIDKINKGKG